MNAPRVLPHLVGHFVDHVPGPVERAHRVLLPDQTKRRILFRYSSLPAPRMSALEGNSIGENRGGNRRYPATGIRRVRWGLVGLYNSTQSGPNLCFQPTSLITTAPTPSEAPRKLPPSPQSRPRSLLSTGHRNHSNTIHRARVRILPPGSFVSRCTPLITPSEIRLLTTPSK